MDIDKRDRSELKAFFVKNAIPTENNFADLIEAGLNQKDDGIAKLPDDPLSLEAAGDAAGPQKAINFYRDFGDPQPAWTLSLNPRLKPQNPDTARAGFSISDGDGDSKLFIDQATGHVGVGTLEPTDKLTIADGSLRIAGGSLTVEGDAVRAPGIRIDDSRNTHLDVDGAFYRFGGQVYLTVDNNLYIRDSGGNAPFRLETDSGRLTVGSIAQESWKAPSFKNGWVNYGATYNLCGYFKDSMGIVHLRGLVKNGSVAKAIFTLPAGYRPARRELQAAITSNKKVVKPNQQPTGDLVTNVAGRVDVLPTGDVFAHSTVNPDWLSLDGITFRAK